MPKLGMGPIRRRQLIDAAIASIHEYGLADTTVARIAAKAGVSAGIVHHYFTGKDDLLFATMRQLLADLRTDVVARYEAATTPTARLHAIIDACFGDLQFSPEVIAAWLGLYGSARQSPRLQEILTIYHRRLRSNLIHALRPMMGAREAENLAEGLAAMIDGLWVRHALKGGRVDPAIPRAITSDYLTAALQARFPEQKKKNNDHR
jgi:TetR/AcrR family transcriptional repressor of bet genes